MQDNKLKPMPFWESLIVFAIPTILFILSFFILDPWLRHSMGMSDLVAHLVAMDVALGALFIASLVRYKLEGNKFEWKAFTERMRYDNFKFKYVLFAVLMVIVCTFGLLGLKSISSGLISNGIIPIPDNIIAMNDPRITVTTEILNNVAGGHIAGSWGLIPLLLASLLLNIMAEEFWWRGLALPRQELTHGKATWIIHALLWAFSHFYKWWEIIPLLAPTLVFSFVAQKTKSNIPTFIAHFLFNLSSTLAVILAVFGMAI